MPTPDSRFDVNSKEIAAQIIGGEAILINLSNGVYYSMDGASSSAWALISHHHSLAAVAQDLAARYDVDAARAEADVSELAATLVEYRIIEPANGSSPAPVETISDLPAAGQSLAYTKLGINAYTDMGALLSLDPPMPGIDDIPWKAAKE